MVIDSTERARPVTASETQPDSGGSRKTVDGLDLRILQRAQQGLALIDRPYLPLAQELGLEEAQLLQRLQTLLRRHVLHHLGPIYFNEAFGQGLSLAAMRVPAEQLDQVSAQLQADAAVVHLSTFRHAFNLWFTLTGRGTLAKERHCQALATSLGYPVFHLPNQAEFFDRARQERAPQPAQAVLSDLDWRLIELTAPGLPLVAEPYRDWARALELSTDELFLRFQRLADWGILQRIAASPNYCRMGLRASALTVWDVQDQAVNQYGALLGEFPRVSQCSLRPRYGTDWPYNLFAVIHGRTRKDVRAQADAMAQRLGHQCRGYDLLFRRRILKRTRDWPLQGFG